MAREELPVIWRLVHFGFDLLLFVMLIGQAFTISRLQNEIDNR